MNPSTPSISGQLQQGMQCGHGYSAAALSPQAGNSRLREKFGVPTEMMDPLRRDHYREGDFDRDWLRSISPMLAVAVGLAIRKQGD